MNPKTILPILLVLAVIPFFARAKDTKSDSFISFGMKEILEDNRAVSRNEALKECLSDAVRQFVAKNIPKKIFEDNDALLKSRIYSNYDWFLENYRIKEEKEEDGYYKITAEVSLNTSLLKQKLNEMGLMQDTRAKPSLVVLLSYVETLDNTSTESSWWVKGDAAQKTRFPSINDKIEKRLATMGFPVIDKPAFISRLDDAKVSLQKRLIKGDVETLRKFRFGDVLVIGSTNMSLSRTDNKIVPTKLTFSASIMNLKDGSRLADLEKIYTYASTEQKFEDLGKSFGLDDFINYSSDDFSAELVESFITKWYIQGTSAIVIAFDIVGIRSFNQYKEIKEMLEETKPEVLGVKDWMMQKGSYRFKVEINCSTETLAKKISFKKTDGPPFEILKVSDDNITIGIK